jgi:hydrogenase maturation protease
MDMKDSINSLDTLVLGIGNPQFGDDGVGIRVIEILADRELPSEVKVEEAGLPGWGLPIWLEGKSNVILVDAVNMGQPPGSWRRFHPSDLHMLLETETLSLHQPDLACGLALTQALGLLPENLLLYGIEPADTSPGASLSAEVRASLPEVVESIMDDIKRIRE